MVNSLVDSIASTIFESEYAMRWAQAISNSGMSAIVERHRRNARLSIEATAQYLEAFPHEGWASDEDVAAADWVSGFLRDAALAPVSIHTSSSVEQRLKNATSAVQ